MARGPKREQSLHERVQEFKAYVVSTLLGLSADARELVLAEITAAVAEQAPPATPEEEAAPKREKKARAPRKAKPAPSEETGPSEA